MGIVLSPTPFRYSESGRGLQVDRNTVVSGKGGFNLLLVIGKKLGGGYIRVVDYFIFSNGNELSGDSPYDFVSKTKSHQDDGGGWIRIIKQ